MNAAVGGRLTVEMRSAQSTAAMGERMAAWVFPGLALLLEGGLGAGKTTLVSGLGAALGWPRTSSPTFAIVNEYRTTPPLAHVDLYRLEAVDERDFGLNDYLDDGWVVAVEWPDRLIDADFSQIWKLTFEMSPSGGRRLTVEAVGVRAGSALGKLEEVCRGR